MNPYIRLTTPPQEAREARAEYRVESGTVQGIALHPAWSAPVFQQLCGAWHGEALVREPQGTYETRYSVE